MQPDAVQKRNKPFECRVILLGALSKYYHFDAIFCLIPAYSGTKNRPRVLLATASSGGENDCFLSFRPMQSEAEESGIKCKLEMF